MLDDIEALKVKAAKVLNIPVAEIAKVEILKHSIDARRKPQIFQVYSLGVTLQKLSEEKIVKKCKNPNILMNDMVTYQFPETGSKTLAHRPVVVGMGPAGLFCGYMLAIHGYQPILLERGFDVEQRSKDVEAFWNGGTLNPESNVQFGEGGAGTFSDGKLNTLVKDKFGRNKEVLRIFVEMGAPKEILYDSKPHIGTDVLKNVVANMREEIIKYGGEVRFGSKVTGIEIQNDMVCGVEVNGEYKLETNQVVLAIGHSARDTFEYLHKIQLPMAAKAFAVGMRVEHPQSMINDRMYGAEHGAELPAAPYKVTAKTSSGRGVYSFCMCPGGYVVNASSEEGRTAVNGMSYSDRASHNANSAIIVAVTSEDYGCEGPLAGMEFQRRLEEKAFSLGKGKIPTQYYEDYVKSNDSTGLVDYNSPCIKGGYFWTNLRGLLPSECEEAFIEGMSHFDKVIPGFAAKDAILSGVESRTSSPIRIHRDETLQSPAVRGLYPCGEGAGYAGGITSAAMDGILVAEQIAKTASEH
ncbi:MAG: FAD-dependent oxidoreductase [Lachnospiraceae bacterium]|nr:FAD-dependent oxidoreductase [Lachnospiraceae bacterium]